MFNLWHLASRKVANEAAQSSFRAYWPDKSAVVLSGYGRLIKDGP